MKIAAWNANPNEESHANTYETDEDLINHLGNLKVRDWPDHIMDTETPHKYRAELGKYNEIKLTIIY